MRIALDAMGGDHAPAATVEGAVLAAKAYDHEIILVGDLPLLQAELDRLGAHTPRLSLQHASESIGMDESPMQSVRRKRDSSLGVAVGLVKEGKAQALVTAGNTGAAVISTSLSWRLLEGVGKPGIMTTFPTMQGHCVLIDAGANIDPRPQDIFLYGIMGDVYAREILGKVRPSVGLLNIGEEATKGPEFVKDSYRLLELAKLNFIGNVEGKDIFSGHCDVVVCDGFVGNIVLKVTESVAETTAKFLKRELKRRFLTQVGAVLCMPAFKTLREQIDYSEFGGAPLFGVNGICIIAHGRSTPRAIQNAIRVAGEFVAHQINEHITEAIRTS